MMIDNPLSISVSLRVERQNQFPLIQKSVRFCIAGILLIAILVSSGCSRSESMVTVSSLEQREASAKKRNAARVFKKTSNKKSRKKSKQKQVVENHFLRALQNKKWEPISNVEYVTAKDAEHWAFQRLSSVSSPVLSPSQLIHFEKRAEPVQNEIDLFLRAKLVKKNLQSSPPTSRPTLLRRVYFDVVGLLPELEEREEFLNNSSPEAYEELVDQLLASPHFGERWGRHWLDLARYADSNGYEYDEDRPNAYPFRDFVIYSFNEDMPYDQFVRWQIAGDEIAPHNPMAVAATGFCTAAPHNTFFPQEIERYDEMDDMVSTIGEVMLGLTVGCARCHEHKYDPIPTTDYYGLISTFSGSERGQTYLTADRGKAYHKAAAPYIKLHEQLNVILERAARDDKIDTLDITEEEKELLKQPEDPNNEEQAKLIRDAGTRLRVYSEDTEGIEPRSEDSEECEQLRRQVEALEQNLPEEPQMGLVLGGSDLSASPYLRSGNLRVKGADIPPGFLSVLTKGHPNWRGNEWTKWRPKGDPKSKQAQPRAAFAYWMTDVENGAGPIVARVVVNRIWQHYFGEGLVRTTSDFGVQGEEPDHPELLEWLANELVENEWRLKHIHRLILMSAAYRQSSRVSEKQKELDPENRLFARQSRKRMEAEILRDTILQLGGNLNREQYGPSIKPTIPREAIFNVDEDANSTWPVDQEEGPELWRRSVYVFLKRSNPVPFLQLFDAPDAGSSCASRNVTTSPPQALALWNEPMLRSQSARIATRVTDLAQSHATEPPENDDLSNEAYRLIFGRIPTKWEQKQAVEFLNSTPSKDNLAQLCHVLLLTNEFLYVD